MGGILGMFGDVLGYSNQYHQVLPPIQQQDLVSQANAQAIGLGGVQNQQQSLANQLAMQAQGGGPNPALNQLRQTTGQNIAETTGMLGSQKGLNRGLATRMAAQNLGQQNQQAAGQAATLGAQQQLAAQQGLGNIYGQMGGQNLQAMNILQNAQASQNQAINQAYLGQGAINSGVAGQNAQTNSGLLGGLLGGFGSSLMGGKAFGGEIKNMANGGETSNQDIINNYNSQNPPMDPDRARQIIEQYNNNQPISVGAPKVIQDKEGNNIPVYGETPTQVTKAPTQSTQVTKAPTQSTQQQNPLDNKGVQQNQQTQSITPSQSPPMGGYQYGLPSTFDYMRYKDNPFMQYSGSGGGGGGLMGMAMAASSGGHVPGKANTNGDSYSNDTVPAMLSPGEIVIPRTASKDPDKAAEFLNHLKKWNLKHGESGEGFGRVLQARKKLKKD